MEWVEWVEWEAWVAWEVCLPLLYYSIIKFGQTRRQPANVQTRTMVWESDSACSTNVLGIRVLQVVGVFLSAMGIRQKKGRFGKAMAARALVTAFCRTLRRHGRDAEGS